MATCQYLYSLNKFNRCHKLARQNSSSTVKLSWRLLPTHSPWYHGPYSWKRNNFNPPFLEKYFWPKEQTCFIFLVVHAFAIEYYGKIVSEEEITSALNSIVLSWKITELNNRRMNQVRVIILNLWTSVIPPSAKRPIYIRLFNTKAWFLRFLPPDLLKSNELH